MEIIRGKLVKEVTYELLFYFDSDSWYGFPCDKDGNILENHMTDSARINYQWCIEHPEKFQTFKCVKKYEHIYREPNKGKCSCGEMIELYDEYMGACECPRCGKWYNLSGQELLPPSEWGWDGTPMDDDY